MSKVGAISVFVVLTMTLIAVASVFLVSASQTQYFPGEKIKIDIGNIGEYSLIIKTPTETLLQKSDKPYFIYQPLQVGEYEIQIDSEDVEKTINFEIIPKIETIEENGTINIPISKVEVSSLKKNEPENKTEINAKQSSSPAQKIRVGSPVTWNKTLSPGKNIQIKIPEDAENITFSSKETSFKIKKSIKDSLLNMIEEENKKSLIIQDVEKETTLTYQTPSPKQKEEIISKDKKQVQVSSTTHYENVLAVTNLTRQINKSSSQLIRIYWEEENKYLPFQAYDTNNDTLLDQVEWEIPHLSTQNFEIIIITKAEHLDENKNFIEDIFDKVKDLDNIFKLIPKNDFIRVVFERQLTSKNDITIYAKSNSSKATVEVYEKDSDKKIAEFPPIEEYKEYKVLLNNLNEPQDTFDLKVTGAQVEFDQIIDPSTYTKICYFNSYSSSNWDANAASMVDGNTATFARDNNDGHTETLDANNCSSTDLGDISKVEVRYHAYKNGNARTIRAEVVPIFSGGNGDTHDPGNVVPGSSATADYISWIDITSDTNAPSTWSWTDVQNLDMNVITQRPNNGRIYVSNVEVRVTYTGNFAPSISSVVLNSTLTTNMTTENLTCYPTASDPDSDPINYTYNWIKNSTSYATLNLPFNTGSDNTSTTDYSGDYTITSTALYSSSGSHDSSGYYSFNGSTTLTIDSDMSSIFGDSGTVMFWIRTSQSGSNTVWLAPGIFGVEQNGGGNDIFWGHINAAGNIGITAGNGATAFTSSAINDNTWHHIAMTRNSTSGQVQIYLDGSFSSSATSETGLKTSAFQEIGVIGDTGGTPTYFIGDLDDFLAFPFVMGQEQIHELYLGNYNNIVSQETKVADVWQCNVTPNDNYLEGTSQTSNSLVILPYEIPKTIGLEVLYPTADVNVYQNEFFNVTLNLTCLTGDCGTINLTLDPVQETFEDFELGEGSFTHGQYSGGVDDWHRSSESSHDGTYSFKAGDTGSGTYSSNANSYLQTPTYDIVANSTFQFYQYLYSEQDYDGGKLEYSLDEGAWTKVTSFNSGGYNGNINNWNSIAGFTDGEAVWDNTIGSAGAFSLVDVNMTPFSSGTNITFRWRFGSDTNTEYEGWYIDSINFTTITPGGSKGIIPTNSGSPFYTTTQNPFTSNSLSQGDSQTIVFNINATGTLDSTYIFFAYANLTSLQSISNQTSSWNVTIKENIQPVNITINAPLGTTADPTPHLNVTVFQQTADTLWYNIDGGANQTVCQDCIGEETKTMFVDSEGTYQLNVYANNSNGDLTFKSASFTIDLNNNFYEDFQDNDSILSKDSRITYQIGNVSLSSQGTTSNFYDFETGSLGSDWTTYSGNTYSNIGVRTESAYSGTYSVIADSTTNGNYELSELISTYDFTGTKNFNLTFWYIDLGDEDNSGSDHVGHQNSDSLYFTCDGSQWYYLMDLFGTRSWQEVTIDISQDPDFCSEITSDFAIKFTQYDNYDTSYDGIGWDDINLTYDAVTSSELESRPIHTTNPIAEFTNVSWNYEGVGDLVIQLSADNGTNWQNATNNQELVAITGGNDLKYKVIFNGSGRVDLTLLDLNITWTNTASPPPSITINSPPSTTFPDTTPILNVTLNSTATHLWYTLNGGSRQDICQSCSGTITQTLYLEENSYSLAVYADNSVGDTNSKAVSFTVDMNGNYFDTFNDDSQIWSINGAEWQYGNISYSDPDAGTTMYETFDTNLDNWTFDGGTWSLSSGTLLQSENTAPPGGFAIYNNVNMQSGKGYNISYTAYDDDNDEDSLVFRYLSSTDHYKCAFRIDTNSANSIGLIRVDSGVETILAPITQTYTENAWNDYKLTVENNNISCYLNGVLVATAYDDTWETGGVGLMNTYHQNTLYDNYTVEAWTTSEMYAMAYPMTLKKDIVEILNVSWSEYIENSQNNMTVMVSPDNGVNWYDAVNGQGIGSTALGNELVYKIIFDTIDTSLLSLLDLNITWTHTASPPPIITITDPGTPLKDTTPIIETSLSGPAESYWYTINNGPQNEICTDCSGTQNVLLLLEEGNYDIDFYANNSIGTESTNSISFEVDMQRNYFDTYNDSSQISSVSQASWQYGNITYNGQSSGIIANELFSSNLNNWTFSGGSWALNSGNLRQSDNTAPPGGFAIYNNIDMQSDMGYNISYTTYDDDNDENGILFRYKDSNNYYKCSFSIDTNPSNDYGLIKVEGGAKINLANYTEIYTENAWNYYTLIVENNNISCYVNGNLAATVIDSSWENGKVGMMEVYHQNGLYDNFTVESWPAGGVYALAHAINVSQDIKRISNVSWNEAGTDVNNKIKVNVSVDNGVNWLEATNGLGLSGFTAGRSLLYKIFFDLKEQKSLSLLDLNITWEEPPSISILYPEFNYVYNTQITKMNYTVSVSDSETLDSCWYTTDSGATNTTVICGNDIALTSSSGVNIWTIYANDSSGALGSDTVEFIVDTSAPSIVFINQTADPVDEGSTFDINVNVTDSNIDSVWMVVWDSVIGGATKFTGLLTNFFGDLFNIGVETNTTFEENYNYTIYANDTTGLESNYSGTFEVLKAYFYPDSNPIYADGTKPGFISGYLNLSTGAPLTNHPINIWFNNSILPQANLTAHGTYFSVFNFSGRNDIFDSSYSENVSFNGTVATLVGTNTSGLMSGIMDAGALVTWGSVDWTILASGCSDTVTYQEGNAWGYSSTKDTYIQDTTPTSNYATEESLLLDTSPAIQRSLLKFDDILGFGLNKIPYDSTITSATMSVYVSDTGNAATAYEILEDWDDASVTYNGRLPGTTWSSTGLAGSPSRSTTSLGTVSATTVGTKTLSVTNLVKSWSNKSKENYGIVLQPGGSSGVVLRSSEYSATQTQRPSLEVTFSSSDCAGIQVYIRTSKDKSTWSSWKELEIGDNINDELGMSRYLEYKINFGSYDGIIKPNLWDIYFNYTSPSTDSSGKFNYSWTTPSEYGSYPMQLTSGYRTIQASKNITLLVQSGINPEVELTAPENNHWSNTALIALEYNATDLNGDLFSSMLIVDGIPVLANETPLNYGGNDFDYTFTEGLHNWSVFVNDSGGLTNQTETRNITIDLTNPEVILNYPDNETVLTVGYLNLSFTPKDNLAQNLTCNVTLDSTNIVENQEYQNSTKNNATTPALSGGLHYWNVTCQDESTRSTTSQTRVFNISDTPPTVSLLFPADNYISSSQDVNFTFFPDDNSGITICKIFLDGAYSGNVTNPILAKNTTILVSGIADGFHNWSVTCEDLSSTVVQSENRTIGIDTAGPTIEIFAPADNYDSTSAIQDFDIRITDAIDTLPSCELVVAGSTIDTFNATSGLRFNFTSSSLQDGVSAWYLNCSDSSNHYTSSIPRNINISQPPTVFLNTTNETYKSGTSFTVYYTPSDNTAIDSCTVYLNGNSNQTLSSITNNAQNFFDLDDLSNGVYTYYVTCQDTISLSGSTQTFQFTIDNEAPIPTPLFPLNESAYMTNITFNFTATDDLSDQLNCSIIIDSVPRATELIFQNNTNSSTVISGISDGTHDWNLICYDKAGNSATSATYNFTRYTSPGISLVSPSNETWQNYSDTTFVYFPQDDEGFTKSELFILGALDQTDLSVTSGINNNFTKTLSDGIYTWHVKVTDLSLMPTDSEERTLYVDTHSPTIELGEPTQDQTYDTNNVTFNFTVSDNLDPEASCDLFVGSDKEWSGSITNATEEKVSLLMVDGNYTYKINCSDKATNQIVSTETNFTVFSPPKIDLLSPANKTYTQNSSLNFSYTPLDALGLIECSIYLDGTKNKTSYAVVENVQNNFTISGMLEGKHQWSVECTDTDANTNSSETRTFFKDISPPIINLTSPENNSGIDANLNAVFKWIASDTLDDLLVCDLIVDSNIEDSSFATSGFERTEPVSGLSIGTHYWNVTCTDQAGNSNTSKTYTFNYTYPDFLLNETSISISNENPTEDEIITINATIYNIAKSDVSSVEVKFYNEDPEGTGTQIGTTKTISVAGLSSNTTSINWNAPLGNTNIFVIVDFPDTITENDETNNKANKSVSVQSWHFFYGSINPETNFTLTDSSNYELTNWNMQNLTKANIYVADSDSSISWTSLQSIGKDTSGAKSTNDIQEIDSLLSMTNFKDAHEVLYLNSSSEINETRDYIVFAKLITQVPVTTSINSSAFKTGILWDTSDDSNGEYDSGEKEDIVYVTKVNNNQQGSYEVSDYELRVPANLRSYNPADEQTAIFYIELI